MIRSSDLRSRQGIVVVLVVMLLLPLGTSVAAAQSTDGVSGSVIVEEDETYDSIEGVSGAIIVYGTVTGDISGVSGTIYVADGGTVEGSIDGAAGAVRIDGTVDEDVTAGSGHVDVSETGQIGGDLNVGTGHLSVDGTIGGDVQAGAESIVLGPTADVGGEFRYDADEFTQDPEASVGGDIVQDSDLRDTGDLSVPSWLGPVYSLLANLLLGAVLLAVLPSFSRGVASRVADSPAVSGGVGLLTLIGVPIVLVVIAITIVGIPLALAGAVAFAILIWVGAVYGQYAVGAWILGLVNVDNRWLALVVGLVGFALIGVVPILGGILEFVALLLGLGALAGGLRGAYRRRSRGRSDR